MEKTNNTSKNTRNITIDYLRAIGLILIILYHSSFSDVFSNLVTFSLPMLMIVSGMSFSLSERSEDYVSYVKKRFKKLVLSVWLFLCIFFLFFGRILHDHFSLNIIVRSFLLMSSGIMFVWIYRVSFTTALINPFLKRFINKNKPVITIVSLIVVTILNDFIYLFFIKDSGSIAGHLFEYIITYTVCYAVLSAWGILFIKVNQRYKFILAVISTILFALTGYWIHYPEMLAYMHPEMLYFMSYGMMWTFWLYLLLDKLQVRDLRIMKWISNRCMNIYLWHVFMYYLFHGRIVSVSGNPWLMMLVMLGGGMIGSFLQEKLSEIVRQFKRSENGNEQ